MLIAFISLIYTTNSRNGIYGIAPHDAKIVREIVNMHLKMTMKQLTGNFEIGDGEHEN